MECKWRGISIFSDFAQTQQRERGRSQKSFPLPLPLSYDTSWSSFNSELFSSCLHFCDVFSLISLLQVSQHWRCSVLHSDIWQDTHIIEFPFLHRSFLSTSPRNSSHRNLDYQIGCCSITPYAPFIRTVTAMKEEYSFTDLALSYIKSFSSLSSFSFIFSAFLNTKSFDSFLDLHNLTQLRIEERKPGMGELGIDYISRVNSLISFEWCAIRVTNRQLLSLSRLNRLERLTIVCRFPRPSQRNTGEVSEEVDEEGIRALSQLSRLRILHLEITRTPLHQNAMAFVKTLTTLEQVTLSPIDNNYLHYFSYLPSLTYLSLKYIDNIGLTTISTGCSHLQQLVIDFGRIVNAFQPISLHQSLSQHNLYSLHTLHACFPYLDDAVVSLSYLTLLPSLKRLFISTNWTCKLNEELVGEQVHVARLDIEKKEEEEMKTELATCSICNAMEVSNHLFQEEEEELECLSLYSSSSRDLPVPLCRRVFLLLDTFLLPNSSGLTDVGLYYCVSRMPSLQFLDIRLCPLLSVTGKGRVRRLMENRSNPNGVIIVETEAGMELLRREKEKESDYRAPPLDDGVTNGSSTGRQWKQKGSKDSEKLKANKKENKKGKEKQTTLIP